MCWGQEAVGLNILLPPGWERCLEISPRNWEKIFLGQVGHEISSIFTGYFRWILIYLDDTRVSDGLVRDGRSHDGYTATRSSGCRQRPSQECSNLGMNSVHRSVFFFDWLVVDRFFAHKDLLFEFWDVIGLNLLRLHWRDLWGAKGLWQCAKRHCRCKRKAGTLKWRHHLCSRLALRGHEDLWFFRGKISAHIKTQQAWCSEDFIDWGSRF
jgi:hypothetical protein